MDPTFFFASLYMAWAYVQREEYQQAVTELLETRTMPGGYAAATSELAYIYAMSGRRREAERMVHELEAHASREYTDPYYVAIAHLGSGALDEMFSWLEKAHADHSVWLVWLNVEPKFDRVRRDPRFTALQRRLNLPR